MPSGSAIVVPQKSEGIPYGGNTGLLKLVKCVVMVDSVAPDTDVADIILASGDSAAVVALFTFPNDALIYDVGWRVNTAFTASVTLTLGDTDLPAGWAAATAIGATVADTEINWANRVAMSVVTGGPDTTSAFPVDEADTLSHYGITSRTMVADTIGDNIDLNLTVGGAVPATGTMEVYAMYFLPFGKAST